MTRLPRHSLNRAGISIVELLVGITLLSLVVVSLVAASLYSSQAVTRSRLQLEAAEFQQSELERVMAVSYDNLESGSRDAVKGKSSWTVVDSFTYRRILLVTTYSPTQDISVQDTVVAYRLRP
jgi:type II secretory pathway pseudopilin PulG